MARLSGSQATPDKETSTSSGDCRLGIELVDFSSLAFVLGFNNWELMLIPWASVRHQ